MPVVFKDLKNRKGPFTDTELKLMAERTALLHHYVSGTGHRELTAAANTKRLALKDEPNVIFTPMNGMPESVEAGRVEVGVAMDAIGDTRVALRVKGYEGETLAAPMPVKEALALASLIIGAIDHLHSYRGGLLPEERRELKTLMDTAGRVMLDIDGTEQRISQELAKEYERRFDAKHYSALGALERKAEENVRKEYEGAIRKLAQAATMAPGVERSMILEDLAPTIKRAFS
jgi:hypothetical protein